MNRLPRSLARAMVDSVALFTICGWALHALRERRRARATVAAARSTLHHTDDLAQMHREDLMSYQSLLDESLALTFPASDPICANAATHVREDRASERDAADWHLEPGSSLQTR